MRKVPDWACANEVLAHVPDARKQTCELTVALKVAGEATDSRNKAASETSRFFFEAPFFVIEFFAVAKVFFCEWHDSPHSDPVCVGLPWEAGLICLLGDSEGGFRSKCKMGFGVVRNYWWRGQNAFSEKWIGELLRFVG
jgi:hypothetical protein